MLQVLPNKTVKSIQVELLNFRALIKLKCKNTGIPINVDFNKNATKYERSIPSMKPTLTR